MTPRTIAAAAVAALAIGGAGYAFGILNAAPPTTTESVPAPTGTEVVKMAGFTDDQRGEIGKIIHDYLLANPEVVRDAIDELQRKQDEAARVAQAKTITDSADLIFSSARQVVIGNPDGKVTLVEFFDYNCTYCRRAQADMEKLLAADPNLRVVLKEFPVLGDGSVAAAKVSVAVRILAPEKYSEFHVALLDEPGQVNGERALAVAADLGIDADALKAKLDSDEVKATLAESYDLAGKLNLTGTPSYVTHKEVVVGAVGFEALKGKITDARDACKTATC